MNSSVLTDVCRQAMIELYADSSAYDGLPEPEFSREFLLFIKKLNAHVRDGKYHKLTKTAKIILIAAILALLAALSVFAAKELRLLLIDHGIGSYLDVGKQTELISEDITLGYIPEGFILTEENNSAHAKTKLYFNSDGLFFHILKQATYSVGDINTEGLIPRETEIDGIQYTIASDDTRTTILWISDASKCLYFINGNIGENELLQIAIYCK